MIILFGLVGPKLDMHLIISDRISCLLVGFLMHFFAVFSWSYFEAMDFEVIAHLADLQKEKKTLITNRKCLTQKLWHSRP